MASARGVVRWNKIPATLCGPWRPFSATSDWTRCIISHSRARTSQCTWKIERSDAAPAEARLQISLSSQSLCSPIARVTIHCCELYIRRGEAVIILFSWVVVTRSAPNMTTFVIEKIYLHTKTSWLKRKLMGYITAALFLFWQANFHTLLFSKTDLHASSRNFTL